MADHINQVDNKGQVGGGRRHGAQLQASAGSPVAGGCGQPGHGAQPSGSPQPDGGAQPGGGGQPMKRRATSGGRRGHPARI